MLADGFYWSLSDSKSPQVSRTRLRILAVLSSAVVWIVSTCPPTSKSSRPLNNPLVTVPNAPITIGTIFTFMFHSFFSSLARSRYLSFFSLSFCGPPGQQSRQFCRFYFYLLIIMRSGLLAGIRWSVCMLKSHRSLYYYYYYYYFTHLRVFHTSVSWWFSIGVWVRTSLLKSLGLYLVFWPISTVLMVLLFPSPLFPVLILWWVYECAISNWYHFYCHVPFFFSSKVEVHISLFAFLEFYPAINWCGKIHYLAGSLFYDY